MASLNTVLKPLQLQVKEVISDGHCLYRSIADQLLHYHSASAQQNINNDHSPIDFIKLRRTAADYIRTHAENFAPFIDSCTSGDGNDPAFDAYCK